MMNITSYIHDLPMTLRWQLGTHRNWFVTAFLSALALMLAMEALTLVLFSDARTVGYEFVNTLATFFISVGLLATPSLMFRELTDRRKAAAFWTLPASNGSKILSLLSLWLLLWLAAGVVAPAVAVVLRATFCRVAFGDAFDVTMPDFLASVLLPGRVSQGPANAFLSATFLLWQFSLFMLCGSLFRKKGFAVGWFAMLAVMIGGGWLLVHALPSLLNLIQADSHGPRHRLLAYAAPPLLALTLLNLWLVWRRFCSMQADRPRPFINFKKT